MNPIYRDILTNLAASTQVRNIDIAAMKLNNWNGNQADYALKEYAKFVFLCTTNPGKLIVSLSEAGTLLWRQIIFETASYNLEGEGCVNCIPSYGTPNKEESDAYQNTCSLYTLNFDALPQDLVSSDSFSYFIPKK